MLNRFTVPWYFFYLRQLFFDKTIQFPQLKLIKGMFHLLDIIGTVAFALSGALTAMSKSLIFWRIYYCLCSSRRRNLTRCNDREQPCGMDAWFRVCLRNNAFALALVFRKKFERLRTSLFLFDTIGLGVLHW
jgi:hypothetical protein